MSTTTNKGYSPSVNIKRDRRKSLSYIPTPNAKRVASKIVGGLYSGARSHVIVGAYGSGKSIFLWAFSKTLSQSKSYFELPSDLELDRFHVVNIVGEYRSIIEAFAEEFQPNEDYDTDSVLNAIHALYEEQREKNKNLVIVLDEFGKFLEYAAKHDPDEELYFIQELAEYINDEKRNLLFIATLHQNFSAYGYRLTKQQQSEWNKVQGRFQEVTFNEPVEQLLFLASERLSLEIDSKPPGFAPLFKAIKRSQSFPLRDYLTEDIAQKLLPLDILSAAVLTLALQRYGQNERSLFSFLESSDHLGITKERKSSYYSIADVYDYLKHSFSVINTKHNPHFVQWAAISVSLERAEGVFDDNLPDAEALLKTIGLLSIFGKGSMILDEEFLTTYGKRALGIKTSKAIIDKLVENRIIRFTKYNNRYKLFEGTDLDIELAIDEAGNLIERFSNIAGPLREYFDFQVVLAKSIYYQKGTPRFFQYVISDDITDERITDEIDGYINLVFNDELTVEELIDKAKKQNAPILYCLYQNTTDIQKVLFDIKKVEKVIENNQDDTVAVRELKNILNHQKRLLNHYVINRFGNSGSSVSWIDKEGVCQIASERDLNQKLSQIADRVYNETPSLSSELINKTKLSGAIKGAQRVFMTQMIESYDQEDWGFEKNLFPPAKSIFYSLVKDKGMIHIDKNGNYSLKAPEDLSFSSIWGKCTGFLESTQSGRRSIRELVELLSQPPLKLKYGFTQFWLPLFLFIKRNDFALYHDDAYIPVLSAETLDIVLRYPHQYYIKAFQVNGIDLELFKYYREFVQLVEALPSNATLIETIRPFLRLYRDLPAYSKVTTRISKDAQRIRELIAKAKDPEALFLKDIPAALGTSKGELAQDPQKAEAFIKKLELAITDLRTSFDRLESRFSDHINAVIGYDSPKEGIEKRFSNLQLSLLSRKQQSFYQRLISDLEYSPWLSSLSQGVIGKTLDKINDKEEAVLYQSFTGMLEELDNLRDISKASREGSDTTNLMLVDIQTTEKGRIRKVLQLSPTKQAKAKSEKDAILATLGKDKSISIVVIAEVLKELLDE
ncbi:hypothetical protein [Lewinella sp. LCG006]|uniref:hypothetical protein n=1 Tax=Lewinella sp. LCG006 TaxID=3231911 RepID=UPI003460FCB7